ncbi:MAG: hypothetical protein COA79_03480 [Planctomycetota bacterium]|nr:MAG: hypothetical protein COA79_03480 [Planctomycetota bacterium]
MSEHEFKKYLNKDTSEIPQISIELKNKIADFVLEHKDDNSVKDNHFNLVKWYFLGAAITLLSFGIWFVSEKPIVESNEIHHSAINYDELFAEANFPEIQFPSFNSPKVDLVFPDKVSETVFAFINDEKNNPYEREFRSLAKLSKAIVANFSDDLIVGNFVKKN